MKKLFFSALALVAFSSVSIGNTVADDNKMVEEVKENIQIKMNSDCHYLSFLTYNSARESGYSVAQSQAFANNIFYNCMAGKLPKSVSIN